MKLQSDMHLIVNVIFLKNLNAEYLEHSLVIILFYSPVTSEWGYRIKARYPEKENIRQRLVSNL